MGLMMNSVTPSEYLRALLDREAVDNGPHSVFRELVHVVEGLVADWAGRYLEDIQPAGGFEKGQANSSRISIDFVVSLSPLAPYGIEELSRSLLAHLQAQGCEPVQRDVSIGFIHRGVGIDVIPARRAATVSQLHHIHSARRDAAIETDLGQHVRDALGGGRSEEVRVLKLWRDQNGLDFPSFYLELSVHAALRGRPRGALADNVWAVLGYLEGMFAARAVLDPANAANIVSDELTMAQRRAIATAAAAARNGLPWSAIVV